MKLSSLRYSKKSLWLPITMILIIAAMVPIITEAEINKSGVYFSVIPERNIAKSSGDFTIDINITNAPETRAWQLYLSYDNTVLSLVTATQGTWLASFAPYGTSNTTFAYSPKTGYVIIFCTFKGDISPGASGNGQLCTVTFHVLDNTKVTKLNLYDTSLIDMDGVESYYPNNDGFYEGAPVATLHDVAITDITVNATPVQQDDPVLVIVYIENEGTETQTVNITVYAERLTHNPEDQDEVWVGDLGAMDQASGDPNWGSRPEYKIGENNSISIGSGVKDSSSFTWDTSNVAGETYKISAILEKTGDEDWDDNVFIGPEVHVVSHNDVKVVDVEVVTPQVDKSNGLPGVDDPYGTKVKTFVVMNFTEPGGAPITSIEACKNYTANSMHQRTGLYQWAPLPSTWWHILACGAGNPYMWTSINFHVNWSDPVTHKFHIDRVILANGTETFAPIPGPAIWAVAEQVANIKVTVKNEGKVQETVTVNVYANETLAGTHTVTLANWTQPGNSAILYFCWSVAAVQAGRYTIKANATIAVEAAKNLLDNEFIDGTVDVVICDASVLMVEVLDKCNINGFYPVLRLRATVKNYGTEFMKVIIYFMAIDAINQSIVIFCGLSLGITLMPGEVKPVETMAPYTGWNTLLPGLQPPYPAAEDGRPYLIMAYAIPSPGFRDDNPYNDRSFYGVAQVGAPVPWFYNQPDHDVTGFAGWWGEHFLGPPAYPPDVKDVRAIEVVMKEFYLQSPVLIDVNVVSYAWYPLVSENVEVSLFYRNKTYTNNAGPVVELKNCTWLKVISGTFKNCSWYHIKSSTLEPDTLKSIEFHVDKQNATHIHIDKVLVSGNQTEVVGVSPPANITVEEEVLIGTKALTALPAMQMMAFFNESIALNPNLTIAKIEPCKWYFYNLTLGGEQYGNMPYGPTKNTWFELKFPVYNYMIHIDDVQKVEPYGPGTLPFWYKFHVDKVGYVHANGTFIDRVVEGYPYPAPIQLAWRMQPKTVTFSLCTGPGTPWDTANTWYGLEVVAHIKLTTGTDEDPCDNKCTGFVVFKLRDPWGDITGDGAIKFGDYGKMKLIYSKASPYTCPPYDVNRIETYYYLTNPATGVVEYLMPDVSGDGVVSFADVGKMKLIYSGFPPPYPCP